MLYEVITDEIEKQAAESQIIKLTEFITVSELATLMNIEATKIIELCFDLGQPVTINFRLDSELIKMITEEYDFKVEFVQSSFEEEVEQMLNAESNMVSPRPPIITVMGHVDHGKTSFVITSYSINYTKLYERRYHVAFCIKHLFNFFFK